MEPDPTDPATDPTQDPDATGIDTATTGEPVDPQCGNGELDPGEECDDSANEDGDACSTRCTLTHEVMWTLSHDGSASSFDRANDLVVGPDDSLWVVGSSRRVDTYDDVWLQQVLPDGSLGSTLEWDGGEGLKDEGNAIAWTPGGLLAIVGATESAASGDDVLVLVVDPNTLELVWSYEFDGPDAGPGEFDDVDAGTCVVVDGQGTIFVGATVRVGPGDSDAWLAALGPAGGPPIWAHTVEGGAGERDRATAVINTASGLALVTLFDNDAFARAVYFGSGGTLESAVDLSRRPNDAVLGADGAIAVSGLAEAGRATAIDVALVDAQWDEVWRVSTEILGNNDGAAFGVAIGPGEAVAAVGALGSSGEQDNAQLRVYTADGAPWWGDDYNNPESSLNDEFSAVAFDSAGDVIAVGSETVIGQQTNALVRKYHPL